MQPRQQISCSTGWSWLAEPERLSQRQALRLAAVCQRGFGYLIRAALEDSSVDSPDAQARLIEPILREAEHLPPTNTPSNPFRSARNPARSGSRDPAAA